MYITTFYSFKGGVGRTMALVNVAVELANSGRRVVIVDFDLEAPGIDTFDLGRPSATRGIVDFVREYLDSKQAPHVEDFVFQAPDIGQNGGELWVMPSGALRTTRTQVGSPRSTGPTCTKTTTAISYSRT